MPKKSLLLLLSLFLLLAIVGCSDKKPVSKTKEKEQAVPVQVQTVGDGTLDLAAGITGKFTPDETAAIAPKVSGKITSINVKLGQKVNKGDVLYTLDQTDLQNAVKQAEAGYKVALANVKQAEQSSQQGIDQAENGLAQSKNAIVQTQNNIVLSEQSYKDAKLNADRTQKLYDEGAVSTVELERAKTTLKNAEIALKNAQASLEREQTSLTNAQTSLQHAQKKTAIEVARASAQQAKVNLENARDQLSNSTVVAPISGIISTVNGSTGQMAGPQGAVVTIININPIVVKANLSEKEVTSVKVGAPVDVEIPAVNKKITATISAVSPTMDQNLKAYPIEIEIANPDEQWKSDMVVNVILKNMAGSQTKAIIIDRSSLIEEQGKHYVYKIVDQTAKKVEVKVGEVTSKQVVIESGLVLNDVVVTKGQTLLQDGSKVEIQNKTKN